MPCIHGFLFPFLLIGLLPLTRPMEQGIREGTGESTNTAKKSLDGVVLFTATVSRGSRQTEPVALALQLQNLGKDLLVFGDSPMDTFSIKVSTKDGVSLPTTRYLQWMTMHSKTRGRYVIIELPADKKAGATVPLERLFDLSLDGEYILSVEARFTVNRVPGKVAIDNLPFTIRSTPFVRIKQVK